MSTGWIKDGLLVKRNERPLLCDTCPCMNLIVPAVVQFFPFWLGLGDYSAGWTNALWEPLGMEEYDPTTGTWLEPPFFECDGDNDNRVLFYFGFTNYLYQSSSPDPFNPLTGAKQIRIPGDGNTFPPPPYYHFYFQRTGTDPTTGHSVRFEYGDLPEKLASSGLSPERVLVKPNHIYTFNIYDTEESPEILIFEGKIQIIFPAFTVRIEDFENPDIELYAYPIDYGDYPWTEKVCGNRPQKIIYDPDGNILFSDLGSYLIPEVKTTACFPDLNYAIVGKCDFSEESCEGCLESVSLRITFDSTAEKLPDCVNVNSIIDEGSHSYKLLMGGFDTRREAEQYLDNNLESLTEQLKGKCAKGEWFIVGVCDCSDDTCENCVASPTTSIVVKCENEISECSGENGVFYKQVKLGNGQSFSLKQDAVDYLNSHASELENELKEQCPDCEDGKYYGVHVWIDWENSGSTGNCNYGLPHALEWACSTIKYYRERPLEFEYDYGENSTFEVVSGPFANEIEAWEAIQRYRVNVGAWTINCEDYHGPDYYCFSFHKMPYFRGSLGCLSGAVGCSSRRQNCAGYGARKFVSIEEDESCDRC